MVDFFLKDSIRNKFPSIVIFPQCGQNSTWSYFNFRFDTARRRLDLLFTFQENPKTYALLVKELADSLVQSGLIDTNRIYIGGLSLGGFGTWDFIERYPGYFAAAIPICGGGDTTCAPQIAGKTAVWIFHGGSDPLVSVQYARQYYRSLSRVGADVKYNEYPGVRHNSWVNAFKEPGLMEWLFSKSRDSNTVGHQPVNHHSTMNALPEKLIASLNKLDHFDETAFREIHASGKQVVSVRFNPAKMQLKAGSWPAPFPEAAFQPGDRIPWSGEGYYLSERPSFTLDPFFHAGVYYVQEASGMFLEQALRNSGGSEQAR